MLVSPTDHFSLHETLATSARKLRAFIDEVNDIGEETSCEIYWRGQADHRWGITSSLARLTERPTALRDSDLERAEQALLVEAKGWVTAANVEPGTDLEWLALLQHHDMPTRLLDLTRDPLIATFFAVDHLDDLEGRLLAIAVPHDAGLHVEDEATFAVRDLPLGQLRIWEPGAEVSPRLIAQQGLFAIGRLPSTTPARHVVDKVVPDGKRLMTRSEVVSMLSVPLYIVSLEKGRARNDHASYPSCFTARIHVDKSSVREQLAKRTQRGALRPAGTPIDHATCYPDVEGMRAHSSALDRVLRGIA